MKKILKISGLILLALVVVVGGYVAYLFIAYHRLPDDQALTVKEQNGAETLQTNTSYRAMTFNVGYASYPPDYSFFMDGGEKSRADDQETVEKNLQGIIDTTKKLAPQVAFYQEVDQDGDRSYHVDQQQAIIDELPEYQAVFALNYDSPYLFYPFTEPIGQTKSGLLTQSRFEMTEARRYSLPIETGINKFFDLDRAFTTVNIPVANGKTLFAVNVHFSAYTKDPAIQKAQLTKVFDLIAAEYQKGNYVIVGGDFNHDVLGNSPEVFDTSKEPKTWNQPFPKDELPTGFEIPVDGLAEAKIPSTRNLDQPYDLATSYVTLIDGFIISNNVKAEKVQVADEQFQYSDHNPVTLDFRLVD